MTRESYSVESPVETIVSRKVQYRRISDGTEFTFVANDSLGRRQTLKDSDGNVIHVSYADLNDFEEIK